jgi:hypothetical protein
MAQVAATARSAPSSPSGPRGRLWIGPLVAGLAFGLTYGLTQRLLALNVGELIRFGQGFDVQVFPGTTLESLRLRFGDAAGQIRGDLELRELERQQAEQAKQAQEEMAPAPAGSGDPELALPPLEAAPEPPALPMAPASAPTPPPASPNSSQP